ncbi:glycoside hydrolase family 9 protein [Amycolatopsis samaneae]|uniref:Glycoside hydrolase family 9 protein n=1 Tax=Amycolatopsis samaneae TaxID=664691 RepID=A0ABW5GDH8_9PSEU
MTVSRNHRQRDTHGKIGRRGFLAATAATAGGAAFAEPARAARPDGTGGAVAVHVNNVGYDPHAPKRAVLAADRRLPLDQFTVTDANGAVVTRGRPRYHGPVADWGDRHYWTADFDALTKEGEYVVTAGGGRSAPFLVTDLVLERYTLSHVTHYFKGSRCSGQFDKRDRALPIGARGTGTIDARGGWYDATGDFGKHFTQLSALSYFNTLQIPLTAWVLGRACRRLTARGDDNFTQLRTWLADEALFGADYLCRVKLDGGTFAASVVQPGPPKDPLRRYLEATPRGPVQVDFREGGGAAVAALAVASTLGVTGDHSREDYLAAAESAFEYLRHNNVSMTNDGKENIQDDYNALIAAVELHRATGRPEYLRAADERADALTSRLVSWRSHTDYWRADEKDRPYFHPSDAGLPVLSLLDYAEIAAAPAAARALEAVRRSLTFELAVTDEVVNPFGYARELVQDGQGRRFSSFFFPHDVTPRSKDQWWQGENARIASLAAAARLAAPRFSGDFAARLKRYAAAQLDWICGTNPFGVCMLDGNGTRNPQYGWLGSWQFLPTAGGIVNGITGRHPDGTGLAWNEGYPVTGKDDDWRWTEQWLPHSTWYLYAVAIGA